MDNWRIVETKFDAQELRYKETLFTTGNGYLSTRGTFEEGYPGEERLTLAHGVFDDVPVFYTELANLPNWSDLTLVIDGERFSMQDGEVTDYRREIDLRSGCLTRTLRWRSPKGHTLDLSFERFASLADEHVLGVRCCVSSLDFSGTLDVRAGLPGFVDNAGLLHWERRAQGPVGDAGAYLVEETRSSGIELCMACALQVSGAAVQPFYQDCAWSPTLLAQATLQPGESLSFTKLVTVYTSRDTQSPQDAALARLTRAGAQGYVALRAASEAAWAAEWERCDIIIEGDDEADLALRYSLFQLLIAAPRHDERVSIAAKSLSGLGYRGHAFWDTEIFMLPFFTYTRPEIARNMLMYRYHTLPGARRKAAKGGWEGAMFAWESAASGDETTPRWVSTPDGELIRIWCGDIELHITADVAYAIYQYWRSSADDAFLRDYGAEIILDAARFWGSRAEWNAEQERYEINDVIGPDEYHEHVDNNVYTNRLAVWVLELAPQIWAWLQGCAPEKATTLVRELDLSPQRWAHWQDVSARMYIPSDAQSAVFEQFAGFFDLKPLALADYEPRETSIQGLLGLEETQAYQVLKQPDVLMMLYLLGEEAYSAKIIKANWDYYTPRTDLSYGSSLGPAIQAALAARQGDLQAAYEHFMLAARTDLLNVRGNTGEGIHAATHGGMWQAVVFGFAGLRITADGLQVAPCLPAKWTRLKFKVCYRGEYHTFDLQA